MLDERIKAIRLDPVVGRGSCSSIDECMDDQELFVKLNKEGIKTAKEAVVWAREEEALFLEHGLNQRWGDADDPQLKMWNDFLEACEKHPVSES